MTSTNHSAHKPTNVAIAVKRIQKAKINDCTLVILPECFNSPYDIALFRQYSEVIPGGETCKALSQAAKSNKVYIVGGSILEICDNKIYNTCTVWDPDGNMIAKHRKVHLFDVNIPGSTCFKESSTISPGYSLNTFQLGKFKIGLGICYDIRSSEMAALYRKQVQSWHKKHITDFGIRANIRQQISTENQRRTDIYDIIYEANNEISK